MKMNKLLVVAVLFSLFLASCSEIQVKENSPAAENSEMTYYFNTFIDGDYDTVVTKVKEALKKEGFGVITTIDLQEKMKAKLGKDFRPYLILGACSPEHAYQALEAEDKIGTMLPCNVIIQEAGENRYEVAAVNPIASMQAIKNENLGGVAQEITVKLKNVIEDLSVSGQKRNYFIFQSIVSFLGCDIGFEIPFIGSHAENDLIIPFKSLYGE